MNKSIRIGMTIALCTLFWASANSSLPSNQFQDDWPALFAVLNDKSISPDWRDRDGFSIVWLHFQYGSQERAADYIRRAKPFKVWMERGGRLMNMAARLGSQQIVKALLARGETPNGVSPDYSPLMEAAANGKVGMMQLLIDAGADVNYTISGTSAVKLALENGHGRSAYLLIKSGLKLNKYLDRQTTDSLVFAAIDGGAEQTIPLLAQHGFDLNITRQDGETPLTYSVKHVSNIHFVEILVVSGANPCLPNAMGETPDKIVVLSTDEKAQDRKDEYGSLFRKPEILRSCLLNKR